MATNANKTNKILTIAVLVLLAVLVGVIVWQTFFTTSYAAVYLKTGDLYFGKLVQFPNYGLKKVYLIQATGNQQNPLSLQKFSNVFWGPQDYLKINREEVVWTAKLRSDSQLVEVFKTNPELLSKNNAPTAQPAPQVPQPNIESNGAKSEKSE